jgi:hypothetical protein
MNISRGALEPRVILDEALAHPVKAMERDPDRVINIFDRLLVSGPLANLATSSDLE